jgi:hypothetical protein
MNVEKALKEALNQKNQELQALDNKLQLVNF